MLANPGPGDQTTNAAPFPGGATAAQLQQALSDIGMGVNGAGTKVGVISDSLRQQGRQRTRPAVRCPPIGRRLAQVPLSGRLTFFEIVHQTVNIREKPH